jgi:hypothetical protein
LDIPGSLGKNQMEDYRHDAQRSGNFMLTYDIRPHIPKALLFGLLGATATALVIGIPTDVIPNSLFGRMTPVRPQDYVMLAITALLAGILAATYAFPRANACSIEQGKTTAGGFLSFLAVGCPTCNKVVVLLLGTGGATRFFEPVQPLLAALSFGLLGLAIWLRLRPFFRPDHPVPGNTTMGPATGS